ncbi:Dimethylsulfoniopropionate (DSMP) lyase DddL [Caenispirillum salinarum AK4]|uniref:Dimethylsulfoniopropionate (DSMP) lyase DddL n=1 Tax=Caenispirillum salinarum AK4 TaxID=1238182 RepID=K9HWI8_9PROT|nr:dimethylsulfonioproprionate lyase family protein [Caenispirillum salinarum]EKV32566.1 Dimethylsulfoniopropionate (DSMP) lyase DddL [Caenispirillum salinarum AK4]
MTESVRRLADVPDWGYLLAEFDTAYRYRSAGGSRLIRGHMKAVRERLSRCIAGDPPLDFPLPERKPVCAHLGRALDNGERDTMSGMVRAIDKVKDWLTWRHGYASMPRHLEKRYAYADILGPHGPVYCKELTLGLVLFAPRTTYPAHAHSGITESYICLSGATSENDAGVYVPGAMILNVPEHDHAITTSDREPALLAYAWVGAPEDLANQEMVFSRKRKPAPLTRNPE